jgi:hypothetical protein
MQGVTSVCFVSFEGESSEVLEMQACLDWLFLSRCDFGDIGILSSNLANSLEVITTLLGSQLWLRTSRVELGWVWMSSHAWRLYMEVLTQA